jgi:hypothetical protein
MNVKIKLAVLSVTLLAISGCAHSPLDAPWDPRPGSGRTLFDQIPNWDGEANLRCGGHMTAEQARREGRTQRC